METADGCWVNRPLRDVNRTVTARVGALFSWLWPRSAINNRAEVTKKCSLTSVQEEFYGRELIVADRDLVEQQADEILKDAHVTDVALLVVGDPFG